MDDIAPGMSRARFWKYIELFGKFHVKPLLAVVPDNRDPALSVDREDPDFWKILRQLVEQEAVELAQHGFRHLYESARYGLLGRRYGFAPRSEFAGLPFETQLAKIENGRSIMRAEGLESDAWVAPSHSFDRETLRALASSGFRALSDGIALYPFRRGGLVWVPQQLWKPKRVPLGVWTICLHANTADDDEIDEIRAHLRSGARVISFSESCRLASSPLHGPMNLLFKTAYALHILRHRLKRPAPR